MHSTLSRSVFAAAVPGPIRALRSTLSFLTARSKSSQRALARWLGALLVTSVLAGVSSPAEQTPAVPKTYEQIEDQIQQLNEDSRVVDFMIGEASKKIWINTDTVTRSTLDAMWGPIFGREKDWTELATKLDALAALPKSVRAIAAAEESGQVTSFAIPQAVEAYKEASDAFRQAAQLLGRPIRLLTGVESEGPSIAEILNDPKKLKEQVEQTYDELKKIKSDLDKTTQAASGLGEARAEHQSLLRLKSELDKEIANLEKQQLAAPYAAANQGHKSPPPTPQKNQAKAADPLANLLPPASSSTSSHPTGSQPSSSKAPPPANPNASTQSQTRGSTLVTSYPPYAGTNIDAPGPPPPTTAPENPPVVPVPPQNSDSRVRDETIAAIDERLRNTPPPKLQPMPDTSNGESSTVSTDASQPSIPRQTGGQGGGSQQDAENLYQRWHDLGDRAFDGNAAEQNLFYKNHPELQRYEDGPNGIAKWARGNGSRSGCRSGIIKPPVA